MVELPNHLMWPIYLMRSGEEKPENVSKNDLAKIIAGPSFKEAGLAGLKNPLLPLMKILKQPMLLSKKTIKGITSPRVILGNKICFGQSVLGNKNQVN